MLSTQACDQGLDNCRDEEDEYEVRGGAAGGIILFRFRHGSSLELSSVADSSDQVFSPTVAGSVQGLRVGRPVALPVGENGDSYRHEHRRDNQHQDAGA